MGKKKRLNQEEYEMEMNQDEPQVPQYEQQSKKKNKKQNYQANVEEESENNYDISQSAHPVALMFTLVFKILAVVSYFFIGLFLADVFKFIIITLLICFDFWTVKNITARLLIGMRWYSVFEEDGTEIWHYQSQHPGFIPNIVDKSFFWTSLIGFTGFWLVFLIMNIMSFSVYSSCLNGVGFLLSGTNLYGFYKCSKEHQQKVKHLQRNVAKEGFKYMAKQQLK